jgi:hypothetical protein
MSTKDAKFNYVILAVVAVAVVAVLAVLYTDRAKQAAELAAKSVKTGLVPSGARSAPPKMAQSARRAGQASQVDTSRTLKVQRHRDMPSAGATAGVTRAAMTQTAQAAQPSGGPTSGKTPMRSAGMQEAKAANPAAGPAANQMRSAPKQAVQAAKPRAGGSAGPSPTRATATPNAQAAQPTDAQTSGKALTRSRPAQTAQATKPRAGDGAGPSLTRAETTPSAQAAQPAGGQTGKSLTRTVPVQIAQAAAVQRTARAMERNSVADASKAAQAPLAMQRKWNPARSPQASPESDGALQEL